MQHQFIRHAYFRSFLLLVSCVYFVYCNPEYSYSYTALRRRMDWKPEDPPLIPQLWKMEGRSRG